MNNYKFEEGKYCNGTLLIPSTNKDIPDFLMDEFKQLMTKKGIYENMTKDERINIFKEMISDYEEINFKYAMQAIHHELGQVIIYNTMDNGTAKTKIYPFFFIIKLYNLVDNKVDNIITKPQLKIVDDLLKELNISLN